LRFLGVSHFAVKTCVSPTIPDGMVARTRNSKLTMDYRILRWITEYRTQGNGNEGDTKDPVPGRGRMRVAPSRRYRVRATLARTLYRKCGVKNKRGPFSLRRRLARSEADRIKKAGSFWRGHAFTRAARRLESLGLLASVVLIPNFFVFCANFLLRISNPIIFSLLSVHTAPSLFVRP
jgi:hypothetical protein